ncbi:MAG TPA: radical SAM protein [Spirochaetota bacterium]|nr:radical SAM protein [Spirochaetota bacterium]HNU92773.1 radical SAM protein [Spirochaetota bacterium]HPI15315.1 radical SAM protein [Spirochaetota bacterium]HPO45917.1 radical SAM protein [Spirochaetota bacterium]
MPGLGPVFRTGRRFVAVERSELIRLPFGSELFSMPGRTPVFHDKKRGFTAVERDDTGAEIWAAASFLCSGYLRTYLPAFVKSAGAPELPLWAYAGLVLMDGEFYAPALRVDRDARSDPALHLNDADLNASARSIKKRYPDNRLMRQLERCATVYRCLCARNFFLGRFEAPLPTSPACNARCLGCLSYQDAEESGFCQSQERLDFAPTPEEIAQVVLHHVKRVEKSVVSFGQGCEGEPLLRWKDISKAISLVRARTERGTITMNTNGSLPEGVRALIDAGLDSLRVSLNSPTEGYYLRYYRPRNYGFDDVKRSIAIALEAGIFVSINLFFLPGFTDMETEVESLRSFLREFPVNMIQARNLNMDPDLYLDRIGFRESEPLGVRAMLRCLKEEFPQVRIGYYNPPKESFGRDL